MAVVAIAAGIILAIAAKPADYSFEAEAAISLAGLGNIEPVIAPLETPPDAVPPEVIPVPIPDTNDGVYGVIFTGELFRGRITDCLGNVCRLLEGLDIQATQDVVLFFFGQVSEDIFKVEGLGIGSFKPMNGKGAQDDFVLSYEVQREGTLSIGCVLEGPCSISFTDSGSWQVTDVSGKYIPLVRFSGDFSSVVTGSPGSVEGPLRLGGTWR